MTAWGRFGLSLLGVAACVTLGIELEDLFGVPFDMSYRVGCAIACLVLMARISGDLGSRRAARIAIMLAVVVDIALFLTPVFDRKASRGEILFFALPAVCIVLGVKAFQYPKADAHQRAVRQQLFVGLALALAVSSLVFATAFIPDHDPRVEGRRRGG